MMESNVYVPSSAILDVLLRRPVGFTPDTPWMVSCSSMPETAESNRQRDKYTGKEKQIDRKAPRVHVLTDHGLQDVLHTLDELLVDLNGQITQNLPVLGQVKVGETVIVLFRSVMLHELLEREEGQSVDSV